MQGCISVNPERRDRDGPGAWWLAQINELVVRGRGGGDPVSKIRWRADDRAIQTTYVCMLHVGACRMSVCVCRGQRTTSGAIPPWTLTLCYERGFLIGLKVTNQARLLASKPQDPPASTIQC